jgi:raffinose/stachyose/melibiose transport system substrate-binding protein
MEGETAEATAVAYHQIMDKFLEENKHVTLEEEILAHDAYEQKVISLAAANDLPDLFQFKALWVSNFVNNGLAGEVNSFLDADPEWKSGFIEGTFDEFTVDGKIYAVPYQVATVANLFYNKGIFEEVGIKTFPKNMTEFKEAIKILKDNGYIPITAGNKGGWFVDVCIFRGILDRYAGPEWSVSITKRTGAKFTDPEFVAALRELKEIAELGAFNDDINSIDYMQMRNYFYTRKAAMMLDGSGGILPFTQEAPESIINETEITVLPPLKKVGKV